MSIKEALIGVFSDDPINWLKWGIVFAILIGGYIIAIPLYGKVLIIPSEMGAQAGYCAKQGPCD